MTTQAGTEQGLEATVRRLERQMRDVTDRLEIQQLIAGYGPAVDSGSCDEAGSLWAEDGVYDSDPHPMHGPKAVADVMRGPGHQSYIHGGCAHFLGPAHIVLDGDRAEATCYSMLVRKEPEADRFYVFRLSANRWEFTRTSDGWKVQLRTNKLLDGREEARALLAKAAGVRDMTKNAG